MMTNNSFGDCDEWVMLILSVPSLCPSDDLDDDDDDKTIVLNINNEV